MFTQSVNLYMFCQLYPQEAPLFVNKIDNRQYFRQYFIDTNAITIIGKGPL